MFRSVKEFLALTGKDAPTPAEHALITHCRAGTVCTISKTRPTTATPHNTIRAPLLRLLILGATPTCGLHARGVFVVGAWIEGRLDLAFCTARGQTVLDACHFTLRPSFAASKLTLLSLEGSHLPGLFAQGMQTEGYVFLSNLTATGTVDVTSAKIGGQLECNGATLNGAGGKALNAQGIAIEGNILLRNLIATGTVDLNSAKIGGGLDCDGATLNGAGGMALNAQSMETEGPVFLRKLIATGTVHICAAKVGGQFTCEGATLSGAGDKALNAQGMETEGNVFLHNLTATGTVDLNGAKIGGQLYCDGATLDGAGGMPLNAQGVETKGSVSLCKLTATGTVDMHGAKIGGQFECDGATLNGAGGDALDAQRMWVASVFYFRNLNSVTGRVELSSAHVGDLIDDAASWPKAPDDLILDGFTYDRIAGHAPVTLAGRSDWLTVGSSVKGDFRPHPYTQFARVLRNMGHASEARKVLFTRDCKLFDAAEEADRAIYQVAFSGDQTQRADVGMIWFRIHLRRIWSWLSRIAIGHGHKPERALGCILLLTSIAWLLAALTWIEGSFAPNSDVILTSQDWQDSAAKGCMTAPIAGCDPNPASTWSNAPDKGMDWDSFNALAYAADLVVPLVDLGQTSAWAPSKDRGVLGYTLWWGRWFFIFAGWVVASLGLAAVTGFVQKNAPD